jgi:hypothetical protein
VDAALAPLSFSPIRTGFPTQEVGVVLPLLDSAEAKISRLEEAISNQLEAEGHILEQVVVEHVMLCFCSRDPRSPWSWCCRGQPRSPKRSPGLVSRKLQESWSRDSSVSLKMRRSSCPVAVGPFCV